MIKGAAGVTGMAAVALLAGSGRASAIAYAVEEWCSVDPTVLVTVNGRPVVVNVSVQVRRQDAALLHTATASASADGSTVTVNVVGPDAPFRATAAIRRLGLRVGDPDWLYAPRATATLTFADVDPSAGPRW